MDTHGGIPQIFDSAVYGALCGNAAHKLRHRARAPKGDDGMAVLLAHRGIDTFAIDDGYSHDLYPVSACGQPADGGCLLGFLSILPKDC